MPKSRREKESGERRFVAGSQGVFFVHVSAAIHTVLVHSVVVRGKDGRHGRGKKMGVVWGSWICHCDYPVFCRAVALL